VARRATTEHHGNSVPTMVPVDGGCSRNVSVFRVVRAGSRSAGSHAYATRAPCISLGRAGADLSETFGIVLAP